VATVRHHLHPLSAVLEHLDPGGLAYLNFFTHHYGPDIRIGLFALSAVLFGRSWFVFTPDEKPRRMPMIVGLCWSRCSSGSPRTWARPPARGSIPARRTAGRWCRREDGAWYLLMLISFVLVSLVHRPVDACVARIREGIRAAV
jgi:hypothetical protein